MGERADDAMDAAVVQLNQDLAAVEAITDDGQRRQERAAAEHRYLNAVTGDDGAS